MTCTTLQSAANDSDYAVTSSLSCISSGDRFITVLQTALVAIVSAAIILSNVVNLLVLASASTAIPLATRIFLMNLSVSDLLVGLIACAPAILPAATDKWIYGDYTWLRGAYRWIYRRKAEWGTEKGEQRSRRTSTGRSSWRPWLSLPSVADRWVYGDYTWLPGAYLQWQTGGYTVMLGVKYPELCTAHHAPSLFGAYQWSDCIGLNRLFSYNCIVVINQNVR